MRNYKLFLWIFVALCIFGSVNAFYFGNSSDGSVVFTTSTKSFGSLVNGSDYNVSGNTLFLNLNRPYNFVNFTLGSGTVLSTQNSSGAVLVLYASDTLNISGVVNFSRVLPTGTCNSSFSVDGLNFSCPSTGQGGKRCGLNFCDSVSDNFGYGGGGRGNTESGCYNGLNGNCVLTTAGYGGYGGFPFGTASNGGSSTANCNEDVGALSSNVSGYSAGSGGGSVSTITCSYGTHVFANGGNGGSSYGAPGGDGSGYITHDGSWSAYTYTFYGYGGGGAGGIAGIGSMNVYVSALNFISSGIFDLSGSNGGDGGNSGRSATWSGFSGWGGGAGSGGGGGNAGNLTVYAKFFNDSSSKILSKGIAGNRGQTGFNDGYTYQSGESGVNGSDGFFVSVVDGYYISPLSFSLVESAGVNFSFSSTVFTNSSANLSFVVSCVVPNSNFSCFVSNFSSNGNSSVVLPIVFSSVASTPDGNYSAYLNVTRVFDNRTDRLNFSLGVSTLFGVPVINNFSSPVSISLLSSDTYVKSFNLSNNGSFNLSNCNAFLDGGFLGFSFYSFTLVNLSVNQSVLYNVSFSSVPAGVYSGHLQITCVATAGGLSNSLSSSNSPIVALVSSSPPVVPPSGGGGGGVTIVSPVNGSSLFSFESSSGSSSPVLLLYPGGSRVLELVLHSVSINDVSVNVVCDGVFCSNVVLSDSVVSLSSGEFKSVFVNVSLPSGFSSGQFDVVASSGLFSKSVRVSVQSSLFALYLSRLDPFGSNGLLSVGGLVVPRLLVYLVLEGLLLFGVFNFFSQSKFLSLFLIVSFIVSGLLMVIFI